MTESPFGNNKSVLGEAFLPLALVGRNEEMAELRRGISPGVLGRHARNVWLHGPAGTGKSSAAKLLLNELEPRGMQGVYVNCWEADTFHAVLDRAIRDLRIPGAERLSRIFKLERLEQALGGKPLLMVLDEFDKPCPKERDAIIYNLCAVPNVVLICISNSRFYYQALDSRVRSRLDAVLVEFKPYSLEQIEQILRQRAELALGPDAVDSGVLSRIARLANGDARVALQTLGHAAAAAEQGGVKRILPQHIRAGHVAAAEEKGRYRLTGLGEHHALVYGIIRERPGIQSTDLWKEYLLRCRRNRLRPASPRTFLVYLKRLVEADLIMYRRVLGVRGNIRMFRARDSSD